jgi:hypothetical protein
MASIILSFVGNQDPVSDNTGEEGSIVTLVRHLLQEQKATIKQILLLHTQETQDRAELTKGWLEDEPIALPGDCIQLIPVSPALSLDPVNLLLAANEARKGIEQGLQYFSPGDQLQFNASSGTPVMKSAWNVLQAAGYAPHSQVWQIRNPNAMKEGQQRVFATNVDTLKREFDIKVIKRQIQDYNYSGALVTLQESNFELDILEGLLNYAQYRISFDFNRASTVLTPIASFIDSQWHQQISGLRQKNQPALLREIYWHGLIKLKNQNYSEFLILASGFQERFVWMLVTQELGIATVPTNHDVDITKFWKALKIHDSGNLDIYLKNYQLRKGRQLVVDYQKLPNRFLLKIMVEYFPNFKSSFDLLSELDETCSDRNNFVHNFEGVSKIDNLDKILAVMRKLLTQANNYSKENPFDLLNETLNAHLDQLVKPLT